MAVREKADINLMTEKKDKEVVISSSWFGNLFLVVVVAVILGAALVYKEFLG